MPELSGMFHRHVNNEYPVLAFCQKSSCKVSVIVLITLESIGKL